MLDAKALAATTGTLVRGYVDRAMGPIRERLAAVEAREPEPGKDGSPGKDGQPGKDGLGFEDLTIDYDGERTFTFRLQRAEETKEFPFTVPFPLDQGVYKEGRYQRGDSVTFGGSIWIAQKDTDTKPGGDNSDWRLAVKKGRDAKGKV